jgi:epoxyqueuosine reductase
MTIDVEGTLKDHGFRGRVVSVEHLAELEQEIAERRALMDEKLYNAYMQDFGFRPPADLPQAQSIIVVAMPDPRTSIRFDWNGQTASFVVPPTYVSWRDKDLQVRRMLEQQLAPAGYRVVDAILPKKLLAARSGLATYGRNNITYVAGMGSFYRLAAFFSDVPCNEEQWVEPQLLPRCENCRACLRACPTAAISGERFLLYAERCLTFHNEKDSAVPLPQWLDPAANRWLVGCLHCQEVCPQDKPYFGWLEEGPLFSEDETALLRQGVRMEVLPAPTLEKLQSVGLDTMYEVLARNLRLLLERQETSG